MGIATVPSVFCHPDLHDRGFAAERRNGGGHGYLPVLVIASANPIVRDFRLVGTPSPRSVTETRRRARTIRFTPSHAASCVRLRSGRQSRLTSSGGLHGA